MVHTETKKYVPKTCFPSLLSPLTHWSFCLFHSCSGWIAISYTPWSLGWPAPLNVCHLLAMFLLHLLSSHCLWSPLQPSQALAKHWLTHLHWLNTCSPIWWVEQRSFHLVWVVAAVLGLPALASLHAVFTSSFSELCLFSVSWSPVCGVKIYQSEKGSDPRNTMNGQKREWGKSSPLPSPPLPSLLFWKWV